MKRLIVCTIAIFVLAACNSPQGTSNEKDEKPIQEETNKEETEVIEEDNEGSNENDEADSHQKEEQLETQIQKTEEKSKVSESKPNEENNSTEEKGDKHQEVIDLAYKIFDAQNNNDYEFLQSVISKGTKLDKNNNKFVFENVTYPHEQEFLTKKELGEVEFRYTHENSADSVIVGFGAIDYENESSFVIDFEFIREDGKWKMNDMDINK